MGGKPLNKPVQSPVIGSLSDNPPGRPITSVAVLGRPAVAFPRQSRSGVGALRAHAGANFRHNGRMPRKPPRPRMGGAAFAPLSDEELVEFLGELTDTLPADLAETVTAALERGDDPAGVARLVRNELRSRGQIPS